ncbi:hypothetical protein PF005_g25407 [Phytophthora fragariae]|uniref:Uncharacterized protein n=1 Tax=Phytophthora fragariae TaxID=53985 RepID=A0A6A3WPW5_9STRA|nr:hypothetical protein PF003_g19497 [Phytophthora fragariae]KAE8923392.1 hypothetical protein PF009_g26356 [Phytophthora fragariae]KAE8968921.1 hypothetical protein PF011_g27005 [Phytophthora fragariae]KAE9073098.1 hypothetical protein PF010_g25217 [Phytophthora fragariae]KAE9073627.1 hypothetical protein PF007_g25735 [Phytophthora fragariae]
MDDRYDLILGMPCPQGVPNSHLGRGQQPGASRGTSTSVGERVVDGEVDGDDDLADAEEDDDLQENTPVIIAAGDPAILMSDVADVLNDSGSDGDEEEQCEVIPTFD